MSGFGVQVRDLTVRYGSETALDRVSLDINPGTITGLLGRNGSGKTTLLSVLAAFRRPTSGSVLVDGEDPWENPRVMAGIGLVREGGDWLDDRISASIDYLAGSRPHFDRDLAERLLDTFKLNPRAKRTALSRGQKSAMSASLGIAARTELTMLDEVYLGMDAPSRYAFYDALLADYLEHPRTIVLSSHLIDEIDRLFEDVVILQDGTVLLAEGADELRSRGTTVTGPAEKAAAFAVGRDVVGRQELGPTLRLTLFGDPRPGDVAQARELGVDLGPVDLQDLFVHLTAEPTDRAQRGTGSDRKSEVPR
ncbi:ABC transporter ATP-binding protein [Cellulomonas cellasea]|uniref:ATP-binding cassette domain-containing protein n=1 Tax=Cellulomonas cellasea TaxID=43670 RepID=UPI0025A3E1DC|nr:ABC transporter ATP-binding protein [Cellulomonas cellasea]MDM8086265.1 ABC transporter ATP-binding protein [Cellulomonas cellasea]